MQGENREIEVPNNDWLVGGHQEVSGGTHNWWVQQQLEQGLELTPWLNLMMIDDDDDFIFALKSVSLEKSSSQNSSTSYIRNWKGWSV